MRKLASVRIIRSIDPIKNADMIELAHIDGWQAIIKKGEFNVGENVIYCEIDSFLPVKPEYEFLRKSSYKVIDGVEGFRIKTIRLKGVLSQGLILKNVLNASIDEDVTNLLGITKYEPPIPASLSGMIIGQFPNYLFSKTDEERIQNIELQPLVGKEVYVSEKLDGCSVSFYLSMQTNYTPDFHFGVCSRNLELKEDDKNTYWQIARKYKIEEILKDYGGELVIQGEIVGPGIQGNIYKLSEHKLYVYNVFDLLSKKRFSLGESTLFCKENGLCHVPVLNRLQLIDNHEFYLTMANGKSVLYDTTREGLVFQGINEDFSFKVISNSFLEKE